MKVAPVTAEAMSSVTTTTTRQRKRAASKVRPFDEIFGGESSDEDAEAVVSSPVVAREPEWFEDLNAFLHVAESADASLKHLRGPMQRCGWSCGPWITGSAK